MLENARKRIPVRNIVEAERADCDVQIYRLDVEQRRERKPHATSTLDRADVAFALRVIGDYMDRRNTPMFAVDWTPTTIVVHYGARRETFTHVNLFDLGKSMYLKRADRSR